MYVYVYPHVEDKCRYIYIYEIDIICTMPSNLVRSQSYPALGTYNIYFYSNLMNEIFTTVLYTSIMQLPLGKSEENNKYLLN